MGSAEPGDNQCYVPKWIVPTVSIKMTMRSPVFAAVMTLALCLGANAATAAETDGPTSAMTGTKPPLGLWLLPNQRIRLEIAPCDDRLCGTLVWFKHPNDAQGLPLVDSKNPDPALRARPLMGLTVLHDLRQTGEGIWEDGTIYNPDDGKKYQARMSLEDDGTLHVRAFVVVEVLGATQVMTRVDRDVLAQVSPRTD